MIDIDRTAELAKLKLSDSEKSKLSLDLEEIVGFADDISRLELVSITPTYNVSHNVNVLRDDDIENNFLREDMLSNSAVHNDEFIIVPRVLGE